MSSLATNLFRLVVNMVVAKTGLPGNFDWKLEFAPRDVRGGGFQPQPSAET
jgi:uncharacterized protein (TIGR03435 family)